MTAKQLPTPDDYRAALQAWIDLLIDCGRITSRNDWCVKAKASESGVRAFMTGETNSLNAATYAKLASYADVRPEALRLPPPSAEPAAFTLRQMRALAALQRLPEDRQEEEIAILEARVRLFEQMQQRSPQDE